MRLTAKPAGVVNRFYRAMSLTPPFDIAWGSELVAGPYRLMAVEVLVAGAAAAEVLVAGAQRGQVRK